MSQAERERRHVKRLAQINTVQVVSGRGDDARIDHEATLLERARMLDEEMSSHSATERGLAAFDRLLRSAETHGPAAAPALVQFIEAVWNRKAFQLGLLREVPTAMGDDMVAVLDAFRYARVDLVEQVRGGAARVTRACASAGSFDKA
ncbi:DUF7673 family protein [Ramlibacter albus]|uniref:DUF7673 domain-containing protein n=1 Tax=Ramlibacter albus TaxID=2079448 RepID=A0A923M467_9BURK|nr:hypothetical protein [Ramlibacter albus]MBC5763872.1 hypothetical protein [Ramlibacter albus]